MSTAPTVSCVPSRILATMQSGELSTSLVVHAPCGNTTDTATAEFLVGSGRHGAAATWSARSFPFTAEGERLARAKFAALVSAAAVVQS